MKTNIEISARHIHLTKEDFVKLFNKDELTVRNYLESAKEEFAANETVEIIGPGGRFLNVRILGPFRQYSQFELSMTDSRQLDVEAPLEISGKGEGASVRVIGTKGEMTKNIAIIAIRHLHISPSLAAKNKLKNESKIKVLISGRRGLIFDNVVVRINPNFKNHLHLDTDEGNAAAVNGKTTGQLIIS